MSSRHGACAATQFNFSGSYRHLTSCTGDDSDDRSDNTGESPGADSQCVYSAGSRLGRLVRKARTCMAITAAAGMLFSFE